jgi:hypothetical protein
VDEKLLSLNGPLVEGIHLNNVAPIPSADSTLEGNFSSLTDNPDWASTKLTPWVVTPSGTWISQYPIIQGMNKPSAVKPEMMALILFTQGLAISLINSVPDQIDSLINLGVKLAISFKYMIVIAQAAEKKDLNFLLKNEITF